MRTPPDNPAIEPHPFISLCKPPPLRCVPPPTLIAHHARGLVHSQTGLDVRMSQNFRVLEVAWASAICAVRGRAAAEPLKLEDFLDPPNDGGPEDYWNSQRKLETT